MKKVALILLAILAYIFLLITFQPKAGHSHHRTKVDGYIANNADETADESSPGIVSTVFYEKNTPYHLPVIVVKPTWDSLLKKRQTINGKIEVHGLVNVEDQTIADTMFFIH